MLSKQGYRQSAKLQATVWWLMLGGHLFVWPSDPKSLKFWTLEHITQERFIPSVGSILHRI